MENKQTAVDWVFDKIIRCYEEEEWIRLIEQAKEMEKEQMIEFANKIIYNAECSFTGRAYLEKDINEIYNETYGN